jgi:thiamine pyrophosphate-dependent acetolactate synthase large subunit-like protein
MAAAAYSRRAGRLRVMLTAAGPGAANLNAIYFYCAPANRKPPNDNP